MDQDINKVLSSINSNLDSIASALNSKASKPEISSRVGQQLPFKIFLEYEKHLACKFVDYACVKTIVLEVPKSLRHTLADFLVISKYMFDAEFQSDRNIVFSYFSLYIDDELKEVYDKASVQHKEVIELLEDLVKGYFQEYPEAKTVA